jgi:hypothetical protein
VHPEEAYFYRALPEAICFWHVTKWTMRMFLKIKWVVAGDVLPHPSSHLDPAK